MVSGSSVAILLRRLLAAAVALSAAAGLQLSAAFAQSGLGEPALASKVEILMFDEPGCPWCRRWHAEVGPGYPHTPEGKRAPLRRLDLHTRLPDGIVLTAPVRFSPTFVLISDGREVGRINGYPGADFFWPMFGDLLNKLEPVPGRSGQLRRPSDMQEALAR
jgi:hypothetical protein